MSGTPGEHGAKSRLRYQAGRREIELIETIVIKNRPNEFTGTYEADAMTNTMFNRFTSQGNNQTRWEAHIRYTSFNGFMPNLIALLIPGMFRKQTQKWLDQFKAFVESS